MKTVFVDTSFYVAFVNPRDPLHEAASEFILNYAGKSLTTEYVLLEVGNSLGRAGDRRVFVNFMISLRRDFQTTILPATHGLFEAALQLYGRRLDKAWSMTDCSSFVVMQQFRLTDALTADHHFAQAGFTTLLGDA
jgi:predicted nucleic acid-binding protein